MLVYEAGDRLSAEEVKEGLGWLIEQGGDEE